MTTAAAGPVNNGPPVAANRVIRATARSGYSNLDSCRPGQARRPAQGAGRRRRPPRGQADLGPKGRISYKVDGWYYLDRRARWHGAKTISQTIYRSRAPDGLHPAADQPDPHPTRSAAGSPRPGRSHRPRRPGQARRRPLVGGVPRHAAVLGTGDAARARRPGCCPVTLAGRLAGDPRQAASRCRGKWLRRSCSRRTRRSR